MKLWLLRPVNEYNEPWTPPWDKTFGFVIRAATEQEARECADANGSDETRFTGKRPWLDASLTTCEELTAEGEPGVILEDFSAG